MSVFKANIPAMIVLGMAAVLAWNDKSGWGWFVFAGFCLLHTSSSGAEK